MAVSSLRSTVKFDSTTVLERLGQCRYRCGAMDPQRSQLAQAVALDPAASGSHPISVAS
jgi:hypothetical protein